MKNRILYTLLLSISLNFSFAQDPLFSQYHSNALYLNPAFAGAFINPTITTSYRDQWPALSEGYKTGLIEYNQYVDKLHGGIGGYAMYDIAGGTIITALAKVIYSYHLEIDNKVAIQPAFAIGYTIQSIEWSKLTFGSQIDPRYGFIYNTKEVQTTTNKGFFDCTAGLLLYSKYLYGGFAIDHLTQPNESFYSTVPSNLPSKYTFHAGANIPLTDSIHAISFSPNVIYLSQSDFNSWLAELTLKVKWMLAGIGYRKDDAVVFLIGFQNSFCRIGYSYDKTTSQLAGANAYTHEVFLSYTLKSKKQPSPRLALRTIAF